ncbi:hypothetical protein Tco_0990132 [Tanacetum coccineum]|uniref:Uncharacterized protein n=1 Tax=Tanacetum coccineum TaxID=301880 RepID=A0ABQ5EVL9_9ASTR
MLMRSDELYKFCDSTLTFVQRVLHDIASSLEMDYLPKRTWSKLEKKRPRITIKAIDQQLFKRRLMRNLEKFVGGKNTEITSDCSNGQYNFVILCPSPYQRMASTAVKPCQGDSSEFYLITGSIYIDQQGTMVIATIFDEITKPLSSILGDYHQPFHADNPDGRSYWINTSQDS